MDGRIEIYPDEVWDQYGTITRGQPDWQKILDGYKVDALVLDAEFHHSSGLLPAVRQSPQWKEEFKAGNALLFVRNPRK